MAVAVRALPRSKALNVRLGLALLVLGTLVVFWAFSGEQAYNQLYFWVAVLGSAAALYGCVLLANSRVVSEKRRKLHARAGAPREWVRLQCPSCGHVFEEEGARPFTAVCPGCKSSGLIE